MFVEERQIKILDILEVENSCSVKELSDKFDVSTDTIRRDLKKLEQEGKLERTHGGAIKKKGVILDPSLNKREEMNIRKKRAIGKKASSLISTGEAIFIDAGTTTEQLAKHINKDDIVVGTNGINILTILSKKTNLEEIIVMGGKLRVDTLSLVGVEVEEQLGSYNFDKVFLGTSGFSIEYGITSPNRYEAQVKKKMIDSGKETILLADSTKVGNRSLVSFAPITSVQRLITDEQIPQQMFGELEEKDIMVTVAES